MITRTKELRREKNTRPSCHELFASEDKKKRWRNAMYKERQAKGSKRKRSSQREN
jgi:hypothetical protein